MSDRVLKVALVGAVLAGVSGGAARGGWAEALFAERGHDFGPVPRGAKVRHSFVLNNRLAEPITILDVRASCGCTTGRATAATVPPGHSAAVEAVLDTRNFVGKKKTTLTVSLMTAAGREAEVKLGVASEILSDIVLNPGAVEFGALSRGQTATGVVTIDRLGMPNWRAERMVSTSKVLDATLVETARSADGVGYKLTVALKPGAQAGPIRDEIRILTNDPETPAIPILVTGLVRGDVSATPALLALGDVASAGGAQGRYLVRGARPFAITAVEGEGDGFALSVDDKAQKTLHVVTLSYRPEPGTARGDLRKTFRLVTDLPDEPPLELNATLHVNP
jgi:hypothetical protein